MGTILWVPITVFAALTLVWRNSLQSDLVAKIGMVGATQVRFVYGLPFVWVLLGLAIVITGISPVLSGGEQLAWVAAGAVAQIGGTALMLAAMRGQSFGTAYLYMKTEPILIAIAGVVLIGDQLSGFAWLGIVMATLGVMLAAYPSQNGARALRIKPLALGVASGGLFGLSAIFYRGGILASGMADGAAGDAFVGGLFALALAVTLQSALLLAYMLIFDRSALVGSLRVWRSSFGAGLLGALSSMGWFVAFALTAAANVRTLGLIEMPVAALLNKRQSGEAFSAGDWLAMVMVMLGIGIVLHQAVS